MKASKLLTASLLALACASLASATETIIHITGSTAFRKATLQAIEATMTSGYKAAYVPGSGITSELNANVSIVSGTIGANTVTYKCNWSGSIAGVISLEQGTSFFGGANSSTWLSDSVLPASTSTTATPLDGVGSDGTPVYDTAAAIADVAMCDSLKSSIGYNDVNLSQTKVGVIPFQWAKGNGCPSSITNMTDLLAQAVLAGSATLSQFSGFAADSGIPVFAVGRNADSGTRFGTFAECKFGHNQPQQFKINFNGSNAVTSITLYPPETINGTAYSEGQSGYSSGGSVKSALNATGAFSVVATDNESNAIGNAYYVGYLGISDASGVTGGGAGTLTYNGVAYSYDNVCNGAYTFWTYEFVDHKTLASDQQTQVTSVINQLLNSTTLVKNSATGVRLGDMQVSRQVEGSVVSQ